MSAPKKIVETHFPLIGTTKYTWEWSSPVAQQVKNPALAVAWAWFLAQGTSACCEQGQEKKKKGPFQFQGDYP